MPTPPPLLTVLPLTPTEMWSPVSTANVTLFRPSTFFIIAQTQLGLQLDIQLVPIMQVFVRLEPQIRGQTCGKRVTTWHPSPPPAAGHAGASHSPPPQACVGTSTRIRLTTSGRSVAWWRPRPRPSPTPGRPRPPAPTSRTALRTPALSAWRMVPPARGPRLTLGLGLGAVRLGLGGDQAGGCRVPCRLGAHPRKAPAALYAGPT